MIRLWFSDSVAEKAQRRRGFSPYQIDRNLEMLRRRSYLSLNPMTRLVFLEPYFESSLHSLLKFSRGLTHLTGWSLSSPHFQLPSEKTDQVNFCYFNPWKNWLPISRITLYHLFNKYPFFDHIVLTNNEIVLT